MHQVELVNHAKERDCFWVVVQAACGLLPTQCYIGSWLHNVSPWTEIHPIGFAVEDHHKSPGLKVMFSSVRISMKAFGIVKMLLHLYVIMIS